MLAVAAVALGTAIVFYIVAVYPLALAFSRRRPPRIVHKDLSFQPTVSIIVTVYNGEDFLRDKLDSLLALDYPANLREILVVSDGSTDASDSIAESYIPRGVKLVRVPHGGKPAALNAAISQTSGEILFLNDVRQPIDSKALAHLAANFADPEVGAATGELRFFPDPKHPGPTGEQTSLQLYWRYELWARSCHSRIHSIFNTTGCIYAIRRTLADPIPPDTLADDAVIPLRAYLRGYRVIFEPAAVAFDYPTEEGWEFQRKLRTLAGLWQVYARIPELLTKRSRMRCHFISHKFLRLIMPWAILLVVAGTGGLTLVPLRNGLLAAEGLVAALGILDTVLPLRNPLKHLTSPCKTFLAMNAAALFSVIVFLVPPGTLWGTTRVKVRR